MRGGRETVIQENPTVWFRGWLVPPDSSPYLPFKPLPLDKSTSWHQQTFSRTPIRGPTHCFLWDCQTIPSGRWSTLVSQAFIFSEPPTLHLKPGATTP